MESEKIKTHNKKQWLKWALPLGITALSFFFILRQVNVEDLKTAFALLKGHTWQTLGVVLGIYLSGMVLRALAIKLILGKNFDLPTAYYSMNAGYLLNNFLPFRLGEIGRSLLLTGEGKNKAPFYKVFAAVFTERILDIFISASLFLLTISVVVSSMQLKVIVWVAWLMMIAIMIILGILAKHKSNFFHWYERRLGKKPFWMKKILPKLASFIEGFEVLTDIKKLVSIFGVLGLSWILAMFEVYFLQKVLMPSGVWWWPAFALSAAAFAAALPSAPGSLGVYEAAMVSAYAVLGVNQAPALALALILHVDQFVVSSLFGLIGLERLGENIGSLFLRSSSAKTE